LKGIIKRAGAQILLAIALGVALLLFKDEWRFSGFVHHLGTAFIVAAIVTGFWHLREVSEVIEKYVRSMLVDFSYLTNLDVRTLMQLRSTAGRAILQRNTDNPAYERTKLEQWIDSLLYERLLPGKAPLSGIYRDKYSERIAVERLSLADAFRDVGHPLFGLSEQERQQPVIRIRTTGRFTVISPRLAGDNYEYYEIAYSNSSSPLPNFPAEKQTSIHAGHDARTAEPLTVTVREDNGQIITTAEPKKLEFVNGLCKVWIETIEYKSPIREPLLLNTMSALTRGVHVDIFQVGGGVPLVFVGQMIATPLNEPNEMDCGIGSAHLEYDGWLFEDHGYHFYWWEASDDDAMRKMVATVRKLEELPPAVKDTNQSDNHPTD